jgi:hypothetical protein
LVLLCLLGAGALEAQEPPGRPPDGGRPLEAIGEQHLDFGVLLGGIPHTVRRDDPLAAARIRIDGAGRGDVLASFLLPPALVGPAGATVPLTFGAGSAGYSPTGNIADQIAFDPAGPAVFGLGQGGQCTLFLGGTAEPPIQATAGSYGATIVLTISYVGN